MKFKAWTPVVVMTLFAALTMPVGMAAQDNPSQSHKSKHHQYKLIDLGTFGGPNSYYFSVPVGQNLNNRGTVVAGADTPLPDPNYPNCFFDCYIMHAFEWQDGVLNDLGTLPNGPSSAAYLINDHGVVLGGSENGLIDPVTGLPEQIAVVWKNGQIEALGTLGGSFSFVNAMNNRSQVVGAALNAIPDPFSFLGLGTQTHAFLWQEGQMQDLGTLGGPDSWAASVNERGQIAGWSFTDSIPNPTTGIPTEHPFLWENGKMRDLKTLGGTLAVVGSLANAGSGGAINNKGQVVGTSNLAGDQTHHPFLWDRGQLTDLGTLGGDNGDAYWVNDAGEIVGRANFSPLSTNRHAFLWKNGAMTDLGTLGSFPCSTALDINSKGQIIGNTGVCGVGGGPGFLSEDGSPMVDLNSLVIPGSGLTVAEVNYINDRGEIAATGLLSNGDQHAILLIPCDEKHPGECEDYSMIEAPAPQVGPSTAQSPATVKASSESPVSPLERFRNQMRQHYHLPGQPIAPRD